MPEENIDIAMAKRAEPLAGRLYANNGVSLTPAPAATRILLRVGKEGMASVNKVLGFKALNTELKTTQHGKTCTSFCIGPDEWLILDEDGSDLPAKFSRLGNEKCSAVDVSHRNTAIVVAGERAADAINSGCPQDLSAEAFPEGSVSRTILGKAEIILHRMDENTFRIEVWRSFSDYAWKYMTDAIRSL